MPIKVANQSYRVTVVYDGASSNNKLVSVSGTSIYEAAKSYVIANPEIVGILYKGRWID